SRLSPIAPAFILLIALLAATSASAAVAPAPDRGASEGKGPYPQLILRGATVIDGTGAPAFGPADVVIAGNRIAEIVPLGAPGVAISDSARPKLAAGGAEIDLAGQFLLPGIIDMHGHIGGDEQ